MCLTVACAFLFCGYYNHTIGTACTVYSGGGTVFKHVERFDIVRIDVGKTGSRNTVEHNQRTQTSLARRHAAYLQAGGRVRVGGSGVYNRQTRHLALDKHRHIGRGNRLEIFRAHMRHRRGKLLLVDGAVTDDNDFTEQLESPLLVTSSLPA